MRARGVLRRAAAGALVVGLALATAGGGAAQEPDPPMEAVAAAVAAYWAAGDAGGVASVVADAGARLDLEDERHPALAPRQVRATLDDLFGDRRRGGVRVERTERSGGAPARAWAELRWETAADGTSETVVYRVFVGFVAAEGRWRIDQIRVLR